MTPSSNQTRPPTRLEGVDHIYLSVSDMGRSEAFYDRVMAALGLHKGDRPVAGERHAHYLGRSFQLTIRPARSRQPHDPYAPGLHHVCFQAPTRQDVDASVAVLRAIGVPASEPRVYPEYNPEYYATFFQDPDEIRLEIVCRTSYRQRLAARWDDLDVFLNPLQSLPPETAAQRPATTPAAAELLTRRDDVVIRRLVLEPGQCTPWHTDSCERFTVVVQGSRLAIEYRDSGRRDEVEVACGTAEWDAPERRVHRAINIGHARYEEVVTFHREGPEVEPQPLA
jgi:glyoxylase I family protein